MKEFSKGSLFTLNTYQFTNNKYRDLLNIIDSEHLGMGTMLLHVYTYQLRCHDESARSIYPCDLITRRFLKRVILDGQSFHDISNVCQRTIASHRCYS